MPILSNQRHEAFALQVAQGKAFADAYVIAGYKENDGNARYLATLPHVQARITEFKQIVAERGAVTATRVLAEYARIAFADITQCLSIGKDGKVKVLATEHWTPATKAAVAEIRQHRGGITIKMHSKAAALDALAKHLSLWKENTEISVNVSLIDLVNGSYRLERGEPMPEGPKVIEGLVEEVAPVADGADL